MGSLPYFESAFFAFLLGFILLGVPFFLIYDRFFGLSRGALVLAVLGAYGALRAALPAGVPSWAFWVVVFAVAGAVRYRSRGAREPFRDPLRHWPVTLLLLFCFLPFFLRWEPPGSEPASLALAALGDPPAASLRSGAAPAPGGIAAAVALLSLGGWVPVERSTHFLLSLGMALLCFLMAGAASQWFARSAALVGTLMLLALYAFPQSLLGWGALSTVYGVMFGFLFLEACRVLRIRPLNPREVGALALGLSFTWQCAPTAALVSLGFAVPAGLWGSWGLRPRRLRRHFAEGLGRLAAATLALAALSAFATTGTGPAAPSPVQAFFSSEPGWFLPRVSSQLAALLSPPALLLSGGLLGYGLWRHRSASYLPFALAWMGTAVGLTAALGAGAHTGEHAGALAALCAVGGFGFALPLFWAVDHLYLRGTRQERGIAGAAFGFVVIFSLHQYSQIQMPLWGGGTLTQRDREALQYIARFLPRSACLYVTGPGAGEWIPPLAGRCVNRTLPGESAEPARQVSSADTEQWIFLGHGQAEVPAPPGFTPVFSNGARVLRREVSTLAPGAAP